MTRFDALPLRNLRLFAQCVWESVAECLSSVVHSVLVL